MNIDILCNRLCNHTYDKENITQIKLHTLITHQTYLSPPYAEMLFTGLFKRWKIEHKVIKD